MMDCRLLAAFCRRCRFPRRMYAGTELTFHDPIRVGDALTRETECTDISLRSGGTGTLIFATQTRRIFTPRGLALVEQSHTVFREEVKSGEKSATPKRNKPPADTPWRRTITTDPVSLFRYSALTFNPHRIHYDRDYAMRVEGYPGPCRAWSLFAAVPDRPCARSRSPGKTLKIVYAASPCATIRHGAFQRCRQNR